MAHELDQLDALFDETWENQKKEKEVAKFKPKGKPPVKNKLLKPSNPPSCQPEHADMLLGPNVDFSFSPCSATGADKIEGTSHPKTKLQPQRKKQYVAPAADESSDIKKTKGTDHKMEETLSSSVDLNWSDLRAPTSLPEIDSIDDVSLEPLPAVELNVKLQPKENENRGKKVTFSVPEAYSSELSDRLANQGIAASEEIQANNASESGVEEDTENNKQAHNFESSTEKENEDAPNLDDIFDFFDDTGPVFEMDEPNEDPTDKDYTGEDEDEGKAEKEKKIDGKKPSRRRKSSTDPDANADEGSPKKEKLPHRIRHKRRKVDPTLLEMPENEINPRQISIRNLILLAEAKEKKWNKEAASRNSTEDQSSMPRRREQEEFEFFDFDADEEENSRHESVPQATFEPTVKKLNYHTYMNRSSSSRWTQPETELFYKGIRQFGTDFAMIQQLFPNRTRHQIKLKFKSEDRKHPTRIRDAITHRLTDNSQFEKVIEILEIQPDKVPAEDSEPSSQAAHWKKEQEIYEEENFKTSHDDFSNSDKRESRPDDDLGTIFDWDNEEMGQEEFTF